MKHLKHFENYDMPELKNVITDKEYKDLTTNELIPYKNKVIPDFYHGSASGVSVLNDEIDNLLKKESGSIYGISEALYKKLLKEIPEFKTFKIKNIVENDKFGIHLIKNTKLKETKFDAEINLWIYYHRKTDNLLDYKKGEIRLLYTCGLRPTLKSINLTDDDSFKKAVQSNSDKNINNLIDSIQNKLYGHPDKEDEYLYKKLEISNNNLTIESFVKKLPKIKYNLDYFKNYIANKYNLTI